MAPLIVLVLRLVLPIAILRWPLAAGIGAMLLDGADVILVDLFRGLSGDAAARPFIDDFYDGHYHLLDKYLDTYYLTLEVFASLQWSELLARRASIILYTWRLAGFVAFELTGIRKILFFAPNLFENFFLFYLAARRMRPGWQIQNGRRLAITLAILYIPKFGQEYLLHVKQATPWIWFKSTFLN